MRNFILSVLCLLISSYGYSQTGYPKQILCNGDTVVAITKHQLMMINIAHQSWLDCQQENDSLLVTIDSCATGLHIADSATQSLKNIIASHLLLEQHQVDVIDTLGVVIKDQKKVIHNLRVHKSIAQTLNVILVGVIVWLVIK